MGTHPIFESDFDCLTDTKMLSKVLYRHNNLRRNLIDLSKSQIRTRIMESKSTFIDVRRFDAGVIETNRWIHISLNELEEALELNDEDFAAQFDAEKPNINDELVFYCMKGVRSKSAALYFEQNGYTNVSNYRGGWWGWNDHWTRAEWAAWSEKANFPLPDHVLDSIDN